MKKSFYEIIGVAEDATDEQVQQAFAALSNRLSDAAARGEEDAVNRLKFVREAISMIGDPARRKAYDARLAAERSRPAKVRDTKVEADELRQAWEGAREAWKDAAHTRKSTPASSPIKDRKTDTTIAYIVAVVTTVLAALFFEWIGWRFPWWAFILAFPVSLGAALSGLARMRAMEKMAYGDAPISDEFRKCPYCAELIRQEATVCRYCQREVRSPDSSTPTPK